MAVVYFEDSSTQVKQMELFLNLLYLIQDFMKILMMSITHIKILILTMRYFSFIEVNSASNMLTIC